MNPKIKSRWIKALRSGKYEQGESYLGDGHKFCCLGVLCELAVEDGVIEKRRTHDDSSPLFYGTGSRDERNWLYDERPWDDLELPDAVILWAGLEESDPSVDHDFAPKGDKSTLASANDNGATFSEIADLIENQL